MNARGFARFTGVPPHRPCRCFAFDSDAFLPSDRFAVVLPQVRSAFFHFNEHDRFP